MIELLCISSTGNIYFVLNHWEREFLREMIELLCIYSAGNISYI